MKPQAFDYYAPTTLDDALALLAIYAPDARPLAGGQTLVPLMNMRQTHPEIIIDLNNITGLDGLTITADGSLTIGAMVRQQRLVDDPLVRANHPALAEVAGAVAFPTIRSRGTLGGAVANAEPGAQLPLFLTLVDAVATIASQSGRRTMLIADLIQGARATAIMPDELLVEITVPPGSPTWRYALREFRRGHSGPPVLTAIALIDQASSGLPTRTRMGISGTGPVPLRLVEEEAILEGQSANSALIAQVAARVATRSATGDPLLAESAFRQHMAGALIARAITAAIELGHQEVLV